jgi:hypothetical protein
MKFLDIIKILRRKVLVNAKKNYHQEKHTSIK